MERLQKVLAAAGVASRRKSEELILAGRVRVNGEIITALGTKVSTKDRIEVDGTEIRSEPLVYYLLNKPSGYVTTVSDTHGRPVVTDLVPDYPRVYPVGRLDLDTEGLLILTNDGDLTNGLLHPSSVIDKIYRAVVLGNVESHSVDALAQGVELEDGKTSPAKVKLLERRSSKSVIELSIHEGKKRQVKRMLAAVGHKVVYLERIGFAFLTLAGLARGKFRQLSNDEIKNLKVLVHKKRSFNK